jgi:hypothetical protein
VRAGTGHRRTWYRHAGGCRGGAGLLFHLMQRTLWIRLIC